MDAAYGWQCDQVGARAHPGFLADFADFARRAQAPFSAAEPSPALGLGASAAAAAVGRSGRRQWLPGGASTEEDEEQLVRDADVVPVCLAIRSLARTSAIPPPVHLDLTGQAISCEGAQTVAAVLQVGCGLVSLLLRRTRVSDHGAAALGAALGGSTLQELDLGECLIRDAGLRLFVKGMQVHGSPLALTTLLLDGNPAGDAGAVELISLVEGPRRPPALSVLSLQPAPPLALCQEVQAALRVVCQLGHIALRGSPTFGVGSGGCGGSTAAVRQEAGAPFLTPVPVPRGYATPAGPSTPFPASVPASTSASCGGYGGGGGGWSSAALSRSASPARDAGGVAALLRRSGHGRPTPPVPPELPPGRENSGHLAAWMAGTERELRELKWLLGATAARLDGQHGKLMTEMGKVKGQLDMWTRSSGGDSPTAGEEQRLEVLETRFDALERLVGREQSECAQMWQIVEAAAGSGPPDASRPGVIGAHRPATPPVPRGTQGTSGVAGRSGRGETDGLR